MQTITVDIYTFDELDEAGQERAISDWRASCTEYFWLDESLDSLKTFCQFFGVTVKNYSIGIWGPSYVNTDAENRHFRGRKLREFDADYCPTGYCIDYAFWNNFYAVFKKTGDALRAFNDAIDAGVRAIVQDMEYQESDEYIAEHLSANDYRFTADGRVYY